MKVTKTYIHTYILHMQKHKNNFEICICTSVFSVRYSDSEQFLVSAGADSQILGTSCILMYVLPYVCMYICMYVCGSMVDAFADNCETIARPQRRGLFSSDGRQVQRDHLRIA